MMEDRLDLDAIEALCEAATDGPWDTNDFMVMHFHGPDGHEHVCDTPVPQDAAFIAQSRTLILALIARVRKSERLLHKIRADYLVDGAIDADLMAMIEEVLE